VAVTATCRLESCEFYDAGDLRSDGVFLRDRRGKMGVQSI
jgi:hypothetical protein